jgi:hypothetical protein
MLPFNESYEILSYPAGKWNAVERILGVIILLVVDHPTLTLLCTTHSTILNILIDPCYWVLTGNTWVVGTRQLKLTLWFLNVILKGSIFIIGKRLLPRLIASVIPFGDFSIVVIVFDESAGKHVVDWLELFLEQEQLFLGESRHLY